MLKYSLIRKKLDIDNRNRYAEDLAYFTHYLHNYTRSVSESFKNKALEYYNQQNNDLSKAFSSVFETMLPIK